MVEWHNFVALAMDYVDWTVDVGHAINVRKLVERESPAEIEHDTKGRHEARMENDAGDRMLLSEVAGGSRADRAPIQDDIVRANVQVLSQVEIHRLNIIVK